MMLCLIGVYLNGAHVDIIFSSCEAVGGWGGLGVEIGGRSGAQRCQNAPYGDTETRAPSLLCVYAVNDCATHWSDHIARLRFICSVLLVMTASPLRRDLLVWHRPGTRSGRQTVWQPRLTDWCISAGSLFGVSLGVSCLFALAGSKNRLCKREACRTGHCDSHRSAPLPMHSVGGGEQLRSGVKIHDFCLTASWGHLSPVSPGTWFHLSSSSPVLCQGRVGSRETDT